MQKTIINAKRGKLSLNLKELFHYKELLLTLAYKDFKVRYAQTFLGFIWAGLQPAITLLIFILVFGRAMNINTGSIPYPLFVLSGMIVWTYFAYLMTNVGNSIINAQNMVTKIYFPRLILPLSKALVGLTDFMIILFFTFLTMLFFGFVPSSNIVFLPIFIFLNILASLGVGIWLSALIIQYRDFQVIIPFLVQIGMYATPVAYPISLIPEKYLPFFYINPCVGIIEGFRWSLLGIPFSNSYSWISYISAIVLFITSLYYFRKTEYLIGDTI